MSLPEVWSLDGGPDQSRGALHDSTELAAGTLNHSALIQLLDSLGLVSSYHAFFQEMQGAETRPTCYLLWKEERPYHIDYCFLPKSWMSRVQQVEVGDYESWKQYSDHRPLILTLSGAASV